MLGRLSNVRIVAVIWDGYLPPTTAICNQQAFGACVGVRLNQG